MELDVSAEFDDFGVRGMDRKDPNDTQKKVAWRIEVKCSVQESKMDLPLIRRRGFPWGRDHRSVNHGSVRSLEILTMKKQRLGMIA